MIFLKNLHKKHFIKLLRKLIHTKVIAKYLYGYAKSLKIYGTIYVGDDEKISLYKKMQNLDDKTREVMYLRITGELSFKEIGIILNKTENWARVTFYRGKKLIKGDVSYERTKNM